MTLLILLLLAFTILPLHAQDEATPDDLAPVSMRMNRVRHPVTKKWGYAFKKQNINSPLHGAISTSVNLLGVGSQLLSKQESELIDWAVPPQYDDVDDSFKEGLAMVRLDNKVGFINIYNCFVIPPVFDGNTRIDGFHDGLAAVCLDGKWGYINHYGVFLIAPEYEEANSFNSHHIATVKKDGLWGAIDLNGKLVVTPSKKSEAVLTSVPVSNKEYLDASKVVNAAYSTGQYAKRIEAIQNTYQQTGQSVEAIDPEATRQQLTYTVTGRNDSLGVKDQYGRWIVPPLFSEILEDPDDQAFIVCRDKLYGCYLWNGARLIGTFFDSMTPFTHGMSTITSYGIQGWIDIDGYMDNTFISNLCQRGQTIEASSIPQARAIYERCTDINPDYASAYNNLALLDFQAHDYNKGMRKLKLAVELEPDNKLIAANLGLAKEQRKERRAHRWETGLQIATAIIAVGTTAYAAYSAVESGDPSSFSTLSTPGSTGSSGISSASSYGSGSSGASSTGSHHDYNYYYTQYSNWEKKAADAYSHRVVKKVNAETTGDHRVANAEAKLLRQYQRNMRQTRASARQDGHHLPISNLENVSF